MAEEASGHDRASSGQHTAAGAAAPNNELYRSGEVVEILGISRRQLQYWAQTDLVRPTVQTRGGHHRYTFQDLVALKAAKRLIDAGVSVQRIRSSIRALKDILPTVRRPLAELVLVATGDIVLVFREDTAFDAVSGQEWVLEVAHFYQEVEEWKRRMSALPRARARAAGGAGRRATSKQRV